MIRVDRNEALRYVGYASQVLDPELEQRLDRAVQACEQGIVPRCIHAAFPIDKTRSDESHVVLKNHPLVLQGKSIAEHLQGAQEAVLMACTLGEACERELRQRAATSPTDALLFGAAASSFIEAAANREEGAVVQEAAERNLSTNFRFSPGYGDFPLEIQPDFLAALDAPRRIGLTATRDNVLVPSKSITAVIGLFEDMAQNRSVRLSCEACELTGSCALRQQGRTCHGR